MKRFENRAVLVTGAASGIAGAMHALLAARDGPFAALAPAAARVDGFGALGASACAGLRARAARAKARAARTAPR
jgi:NADP-dependent 3-hydroxy acid dehydrogenase YdfG